ncbi:S1 family peptidase [Streptosporangium sp. NBC_01469]|uniref:S1 family peptidase n=1 Tax=Streptosporangium sp. NBC_01469 TaxID=2903898 RepID=UPI002E2C91C4|nr:S1 family peptidase [Streptosporangium sp. NBC_01469]
MSRRHAVTTGYVLAIIALTLAVVPAGAERQTVSPTAAVTTLAALKPPPGMLAALQRDLGLTAAQAQTRLLNEARMTPVVPRLQRALGARFGGAWFRGTTAQNLVVATTSTADIPQILAAGAKAEVVTWPLAHLASIKKKLDQALPMRPIVASVRYVDAKTNRVVVLAPKPEAAETLVEGAGVDKAVVVVLPSNEQPRPLYDLVGGQTYYVGDTTRCSIGFPVFKGTQNGFITAGHCGKPGQTTTGFNRIAQGVFQASAFPTSDYAWVAVNANWTSKPAVDNGEGGTVPVVSAKVAVEGASVCRSGSTTDWHCGLIQQRDASITYPQGNVFGLTRTNACAESGDSGGAFISVDQAQGIASGGSGDCSLGGTTYFQPIGPVLTAYGLSLQTTAGNPPAVSTGTCTGYQRESTGILASGQTAAQTPALGYQSIARGTHSGCLETNPGADFDLYLQKRTGSTWRNVAAAEGVNPLEQLAYTGPAGLYRYQVVSSSGFGPYTLGFNAP